MTPRPLILGGLLACLCPTVALAQDPALTPPPARAVLTPEPPRIDGLLTDEVWQLAEPLSELTQVVPIEGAPPTERTEIRILFDRRALYLGIRCFDSDPESLISTSMLRDAFLDADDRIEIIIDTYHDGRNAFFFQMNPGGSKGDALITENGNFNKPWDGVWEGRTNVDAEGWTAELALPYKTLNFREGNSTWGFNLQRYMGQKRESARWSGARRDYGIFNVVHAGDIVGLEGMEQGIGLDVVPFFVTNWRNDRVDGTPDKDLLGEPGVDAFYKIIPSLTLSLTVNTDFAETEVDERQINLTRFPLFFPERRDFFLQDRDLFSFRGGITPFFSRRIGLTAGGSEVPILAGAKLTGRVGSYNLGLLDVVTDDTDDLDGQNLFAGRVSRNIGRQSSVGVIATSGNPSGGADNTVVGFDAQYRTSEFLDGKNLITTAWFVQSDTDGVSGNDAAWGASVSSPNDIWRWFLGFTEVQRDFNAALGFVRRRDIRNYEAGITYQPRPDSDLVRQYEFSLDTDAFFTTDDVLETWNSEIQPFGVEFHTGDAFRLEFEHTHDELFVPFEISDGVTIPEGPYDFYVGRAEFETGTVRDFSVVLNASTGSFYDGDRTNWFAACQWRPSPLFIGSAEYSRSDIDLADGDFETKIARVRADFSFSPELSWSNFVQWDNASDTYGLNSRVQYIPKPGHFWFLVFNETFLDDEDSFSPLFQELAVKVTYTIRF